MCAVELVIGVAEGEGGLSLVAGITAAEHEDGIDKTDRNDDDPIYSPVMAGGIQSHVHNQNGRQAAIKQLDRSSKQGDHEFRIEVDMLSRLHSPYLVGLLGYCADQDHRLLVYEYMPNGNLQEHLYSNETSGNPPILNWETRMRIALDSAKGLEYLHECVSPPVIHRDFKSSNILLDSNFNAKVFDFGLAKLGSDKVGGMVSARVLGTHGYVAPEYALTGHLTMKSDVYSYGAVLLELLTGRVPVDMKRPPGQGVLVSWALPQLTDRDKLVEMVDPVMEGQFAVKDLIQFTKAIGRRRSKPRAPSIWPSRGCVAPICPLKQGL
ncbi:hypothetical protein GOP47_0013577 [Adiantum capillus-veneris]|uniref:Protein kinase domain-containing protein n=1 Tax=Adiantum capillus-veneris TaxID=13818 RepID=A0A9D4UPH4_ADICA|nr:hypothetical protein GOP47_0013577 [Adiantum capillus-veneris]